jgi:secreted PhoX family phosphatase
MRNGSVYFTCTTGGPLSAGQIWRYTPARREGRAGERRDAGTLELYYEVTDAARLLNPDNICVMPGGELLICGIRRTERPPAWSS